MTPDEMRTAYWDITHDFRYLESIILEAQTQAQVYTKPPLNLRGGFFFVLLLVLVPGVDVPVDDPEDSTSYNEAKQEKQDDLDDFKHAYSFTKIRCAG